MSDTPDHPVVGFFRTHPDAWFLVRAVGLVCVILLFSQMIGGFFPFLLMILLPFYVIVLAVYHWRMSELGFFASLWEYSLKNIDLIGIPRVNEKETYRTRPWVTYSLITANILIFYFYQSALPSEFISNNLLFLPRDPDLSNVLISLVASIFLHADDSHLWGNMLFLWAVGTTVERRVGQGFYLKTYLLSGILANLISAMIYGLFLDRTLHGLGASGAIAGVMGIFAVRCYFKEMIFPIPFFGFLPIAYKVRMNALTVMGLFFAKDLLAGVVQLGPDADLDYVNHWAHLGGMFAGAAVAFRRKAQHEAEWEHSKELALSPLNGTVASHTVYENGTINIEEALTRTRDLLKTKPNDVVLLLHLARLTSQFEKSEEARLLYRQVLRMLVAIDPEKSIEIFHEFYEKYLDIADPKTQFRLAQLLVAQGNLYHAAVTLEAVGRSSEASEILRAKALWRSAELHAEQGLEEASQELYRELHDTFPTSEWGQRAQGLVG